MKFISTSKIQGLDVPCEYGDIVDIDPSDPRLKQLIECGSLVPSDMIEADNYGFIVPNNALSMASNALSEKNRALQESITIERKISDILNDASQEARRMYEVRQGKLIQESIESTHDCISEKFKSLNRRVQIISEFINLVESAAKAKGVEFDRFDLPFTKYQLLEELNVRHKRNFRLNHYALKVHRLSSD